MAGTGNIHVKFPIDVVEVPKPRRRTRALRHQPARLIPNVRLRQEVRKDRLEPEQIVAASGSLVMVAGIGMSTGPIMVSYLMSLFGPDFYFTGIGGAFALIFLFAMYRMRQRAGVDIEDQVPTLAAGQIGTPVAEICATDAVDYVEAVIDGEVERLDEQAEIAGEEVERRL